MICLQADGQRKQRGLQTAGSLAEPKQFMRKLLESRVITTGNVRVSTFSRQKRLFLGESFHRNQTQLLALQPIFLVGGQRTFRSLAEVTLPDTHVFPPWQGVFGCIRHHRREQLPWRRGQLAVWIGR
jgi:hypothetical protein